MEQHFFRLGDGRRLSYAQYGSARNRPVLYFHGTPSSRLEPELLDIYGINVEELLNDYGLYLIAIDRPGMGLSDYDPELSFLSFARDAKQLLDHLLIERCPVLCWSGGGPYALAMAWKHVSITAVYILCGFSRKFDNEVVTCMGRNVWYFRLSEYLPLFLRMTMNIASILKINRPVPQYLTGVEDADYLLMKDPGHLAGLARYTMREACRNGTRGIVHEARNYYRDFDFRLNRIQQPVHYWWGTKDRSVISLHAKAIEEQVVNRVVHYKENEGHLSLYINYFSEVLETINRDYEFQITNKE